MTVSWMRRVRIKRVSLASMAKWSECWFIYWRVMGLIPGQGHISGLKVQSLAPNGACAGGNKMMCLSHCFSISPSPSSLPHFHAFSIEKCPRVKINKNKLIN